MSKELKTKNTKVGLGATGLAKNKQLPAKSGGGFDIKNTVGTFTRTLDFIVVDITLTVILIHEIYKYLSDLMG